MGEKHNGFSVLLHNATKSGQSSIKEICDFFKEFLLVEDEYQKHSAKLIGKVSTYGGAGSFSPAWSCVKTSLDKLQRTQLEFVQKLQDACKEAIKYMEEHQKMQKQLKDGEAKTVDAVNLMQTTTTCLQKAKETYASRCMEHEKLRKENASLKDLQKSDTKIKRSSEEYRLYVEKYAKIRDSFEEKMTSTCQNFELFEFAHLNRLKQLLVNFATEASSSRASAYEAASNFKNDVDEISTEELIRKFALEKGTGTERPRPMIFEEPDLHMTSPGVDQTQVTAELISLSSNLLDFAEPIGDGFKVPETLPLGALSQPIVESNSAAMDKTYESVHSKKLSLWLPGRMFKSSSSSGNGLKAASLVRTPDDLPAPHSFDSQQTGDVNGTGTGTGTGNFLKKVISHSKDSAYWGSGKKKKEEPVGINSSNVTDMFDDKSLPSENEAEDHKICSASTAHEQLGDIHDEDGSSSDDDSVDQFSAKRFNFKIRNSGDQSSSASVDQLRDAVKEMNFSNLALKSTSRLNVVNARNDPWSSEPSDGGRPPLLRAAKTGEDRFNARIFAGASYNVGSSTSATEDHLHLDEAVDELGELVTAPTFSRQRPRSTTPMQPLSPQAMGGAGCVTWTTADQSQKHLDCSVADYPIAAALTETVHALFKSHDDAGCTVKVYGSLTLSFPSSVVRGLCTAEGSRGAELRIKFVDADRINAIVPNCQVLPNQSSFSASSSHNFVFNMEALTEYLKRRRLASPSCPFYNVDVLHYEVKADHQSTAADQCCTVPLIVRSFSKRPQPDQLDLVVHYNYNPKCLCLEKKVALTDANFSTQIGTPILQAQLKPEGKWDKDGVTWNMGDVVAPLDVDKKTVNSLKARLTISASGSQQAGPTTVHFTVPDSLISGTRLSLESCRGFRLSLLKTKVLAGRYLCEPQIR